MLNKIKNSFKNEKGMPDNRPAIIIALITIILIGIYFIVNKVL